MEIKTVPEVPLSHPFIERLVGTIWRELLDQIPFWSAGDLERKLLRFRDYTTEIESCVVGRRHTGLQGRRCQSQGSQRQRVPVAALLPRLVSVTRGCVTRNSPQTGANSTIL
jgi:hypothetical protein